MSYITDIEKILHFFISVVPSIARAHLVAPHAPRARRVLRRHPTRECISFALACVWLGSMAYFDVSSLSTSWIGTQCDDIHESVTRWMQVFGGGGGGGGGASGSNDTLHASSAASSHASCSHDNRHIHAGRLWNHILIPQNNLTVFVFLQKHKHTLVFRK